MVKMKKFKRLFEFILLVAGIALFYRALSFADIRRLGVLYPAIVPWGWPVFLVYPFMCLWDVWGWKTAFTRQCAEKLKIPSLYAIRLAGEALNNVTPILDVGGEPLKIALVSRRFAVSKKDALSAGVIDRTALIFAEILFILAGLALSVFLLPLARRVFLALLSAVLLFMGFALVLFAAQKKGILKTLFGWMGHSFHESLEKADHGIRTFHTAERKRFRTAVAFHFIGWAAGSVVWAAVARTRRSARQMGNPRWRARSVAWLKPRAQRRQR